MDNRTKPTPDKPVDYATFRQAYEQMTGKILPRAELRRVYRAYRKGKG